MTDTDIDSVLDAMTLEEQVSLLSGASFWRTAAVPRLGVPAIKVTDGPNGARGEDFSGGVRSAAYPVAVALAATWDPDLVGEIGRDLAREALSKGARVLLAPTVNMHRNPLNGRNFECFSEDPVLASAMAVAYVKGVQSGGVGATIKHFIGNECEFERRTTSSIIDEKTLRETYFPPFEAAVKEAQVACVMTAYNGLNGTHTSQNSWLLETVLRQEWGFEGVVMSDWTATHSTAEALLAGLDLEMPGPGVHRGAKLVEAVHSGAVSRDAVRCSARRILALVQRLGVSEADERRPEAAEDRPATRALVRRAAAESAVLLKNNDLLPLKKDAVKRIAVIGPNAARAVMFGGGSAQINAHYAVSPLAGIRAGFPGASVDYALGCPGDRYIPLVEAPVEIRFFAGIGFSGEPVLTRISENSEFRWFGPVAPEVDHRAFSARLACRYTAKETGTHEIGLMSAGVSRLAIDGEPVLEAWESWSRGHSYFGHGCAERRTSLWLEAGKTYEISVDYACGDGITTTLKAVRFGIRPPSAAGSVDDAVALARHADAVIIVAGLNDDWETEAEDRERLDLPQAQTDLIEAIAAVNPATVVVIQSGSPVPMPWAGRVPAILQFWYPGQECGNALADVLSGAAEPAGRLPQSFPLSDEPLGALTLRPQPGGEIHYAEGSNIGYRGFAERGTVSQFAFGHGLGYARARYLDARVSILPASVEVEVDVLNEADRPGSEVVQVYLVSESREPLRLIGFSKLRLEASEKGRATISLPMRSFCRWSVEEGGWMQDGEAFTLLIGASTADLRLERTLVLPAADALASRQSA